MSMAGDIRSAFEQIHDHLPLETGELLIAQLLFRVVEDSSGLDLERELKDPAERKWGGEKAVEVYEAIQEEE